MKQGAFALLLQFVILAFGLVFDGPLRAAPPTITLLDPPGVQRGLPFTVLVNGANLTSQTRLMLPFPATQALLPDAKPNPAQVRVQVTVDPAVPLGIYPARVVTEEGVSSLFFFSVDAFANVNEVEDNNTFEKAQKVTLPVIVTGQCAGGDVDFYRFPAKKGQRLVVETEAARLGSGVLPQIRVTDERQRFIAADDSQALHGDCRVTFEAKADGDYVVEFSDSRYRGGNPPQYRLKIAEYDVVEEIFPLGGRRGDHVIFTLRGGSLKSDIQITRALSDPLHDGVMVLDLAGVVRPGLVSPRVAVGDLPERLWLKGMSKDPKALDVLPPVTINSRLEHKGDTDRFQIPVQAGQRFRIQVEAESLGSNLDGVLRITDQAGTQLALVDDVTLPAAPGKLPVQLADPAVDLTVPPGVTLLGVELHDQRYRGGINFVYRLTIAPFVSDFALQQPVAEVNVPRGGSVALTVPVIRRGYPGPIQLTVPNLPAGVTVQGGHVPANGIAGVLTITAPPQGGVGPLSLAIEGRAVSEGQELRRTAEEKFVLSRDANVAASSITLRQFALGLTAAEPFTVQGPATVEVVQGYSATIPITLIRAKDQAMLAIEVTGSIPAAAPAPPLFTSKSVSVAAGMGNTVLTLEAEPTALEGLSDLLLQGKAKINNVDRLVSGQAIMLNVRKPFEMVLAAPTLTLTAGQNLPLKGQLQRHALFKEAVQLKLDGLPAGVTLAAPLTPLVPTANEWQIALKVDPKAAAVQATLTLTCTATLGGKPYAHPPVTIAAQVVAGK